MARHFFQFTALAFAASLSAAATAASHYTAADFDKVRKFDSHVHANVNDKVFLNIAQKDGFEILSINVDYPDFPTIDAQADIAHRLKSADPKRFHFATTFTMKDFGAADWTARTTRRIDDEQAKGAIGVKVWKNIGMVERDAAGNLIMLDAPEFDAVMQHVEKHGLTLIAHQAEPKNCWLPLDQMTTDNDREYFKAHPEYHMFLHPEMPTYEALLGARDRFVGKHPRLKVIGAHMGSLEWSVDALAKYLDTYPNATVDLAARMTQAQYQSNADYAKVRAFFIKYQNRILYGSDLTHSPPEKNEKAQNPPLDMSEFASEADRFWRSDWAYLATGDVQRIDALNADSRGLALPKKVIDKIYFRNARRILLNK
jgi:predicted TIM-barrel fold metal-dependent hydrolase